MSEMTDWSPEMRSLMSEIGVLAPVVATTGVECVAEWMLRAMVDSEATEAGYLKEPVAPCSIYAEAALRQIQEQGLSWPGGQDQ